MQNPLFPMKNIIVWRKRFLVTGFAVVGIFQSVQAQYIDDLSGINGSGRVWTVNNAVTGQIQVSYSNTIWASSTGPTTQWANTTSLDHGNSGIDDYIDFQWQNSVSSFDFTLWDWDGGGSILSEITFSNGVDRVGVIGFGDVYMNDVGLSAGTFSVSEGTMSYDGSLYDHLNSAPGNGMRLRVANADGSSFTGFRMQVTSGYTLHGIGGSQPSGLDMPEEFDLGNSITIVPELSSALLVLLACIPMAMRRKRV